MNVQICGRFRVVICMVAAAGILLTACSSFRSTPTPTPVPPTPTPVPPTPTPDLVDLVKAYEDAFNRHDIQGVTALLTDDVVFSLPSWGGMILYSLPEVQKLHEFYFGSNVEIHHPSCDTTDKVTCGQFYADDCGRAFGVNISGEPIGEAVYIINDNKISSITWDHTSDALTLYAEKFGNFMAWWEKTYPDEFNNPAYEWLSNENGIIVAKRCTEYMATQK